LHNAFQYYGSAPVSLRYYVTNPVLVPAPPTVILEAAALHVLPGNLNPILHGIKIVSIICPTALPGSLILRYYDIPRDLTPGLIL